ncbi:MAG: hypothetical protein ABI767_15005 [Rhodanobacter sp.]
MRRLVASVPFALLLAACSPSPPTAPPSGAAQTGHAPANATLGSSPWFSWVGRTLDIDDGHGHGPDPGSDEWNRAVQKKLGEEAPQSLPGSPEWQQSVDALLRTRVSPAR